MTERSAAPPGRRFARYPQWRQLATSTEVTLSLRTDGTTSAMSVDLYGNGTVDVQEDADQIIAMINELRTIALAYEK